MKPAAQRLAQRLLIAPARFINRRDPQAALCPIRLYAATFQFGVFDQLPRQRRND
jgi:hypothetical protein